MSIRRRLKFWTKLQAANVSFPTLTLGPDVREFILRTTHQSPTRETGGILIGYNRRMDIEVTRATDPGPRAVRSACNVVRDTEYCRAILAAEFAATGADYVGEWHTHVMDLSHPSTGDLKTLANIMTDRDYNFESFAMVLVSFAEADAPQISGYIATRDTDSVIEVREVIVGEKLEGRI